MATIRALDSALSRFDARVASWFADSVGTPTDVQAQAWPRIAGGEHVLVSAPTGSGKTLTAFLWALNQFVTGAWATGCTRVLYVSPLKALNNDIQRNLLGPLAELRQAFTEAGDPFPDIRALTRSGDTPQADRRRMLRRPPEILITTPESLNLLLSSAGGRSMLASVQTTILDEIHAVVGSKRGTHLITAIDRLAALAGDFQRLALSATVRPLETIAEFVGGFAEAADGSAAGPCPRPVAIVASGVAKTYAIQTRFPAETADSPTDDGFWEPLVDAFREIIDRNRSTLLFVNSRRLCERLTLMINGDRERPLAYAHHGSLSREVREVVEQQLKSGELKAIVATHSLEMGIDIGALDEVVLVQSPASISSAIQRIGRAGHQVGEVSRATVFPTHSRDFLDAAVLAPAIEAHDIETVTPIDGPLDVLAQVIVSMTGSEKWNVDHLYGRLRLSYPYRDLPREHFDLVLNMLAGRYADTRIRELKARISLDGVDNTVVARKGALQAVYLSGGTIPDRGYFQLRHHETRARLGELDEEFVWETAVGQAFAFGAQKWKVEAITHSDVLASAAPRAAAAAPFWKSETYDRDFHFSDRIGRFLEAADERLEDPAFATALRQEHCMDDIAAERLLEYLRRQKTQTRCGLPHRHHLVVEHIDAGPAGSPGHQVVLHTMWGGRVNRPLALALRAAWEDRWQRQPEMHATNDCIVLVQPDGCDSAELLAMATSSTVDDLLRQQLDGSGFFAARFRECAGCALLMTRDRPNERIPLWLSRLRAQKLMDAVFRYDDFPILLETWRTCLQDHFDMESLRMALRELETGEIRWSEARMSQPSPMAANVAWQQVNQYMYAGDRGPDRTASRLRPSLVRDVALTPGLRPSVSPDLVRQFERKRQRLHPGYSPATADELLDWVKERLVIPETEWEELLAAIHRDHGLAAAAAVKPIGRKLVRLVPPEAAQPVIVALETLPRATPCLYGGESAIPATFVVDGEAAPPVADLATDEDADEGLASILGHWLQFYGPVSEEFVATRLGLASPRRQLALDDLVAADRVVAGALIADRGDNDFCDSENFEILLRQARALATSDFAALEIGQLPLFLAHVQGLAAPGADAEGLGAVIEQLLGYPAPAALWESDLLPARLQAYSPEWLDAAIREADLCWLGCGPQRIAFGFPPDLDLLRDETPEGEAERTADDSLNDLFADAAGRYDFPTLLRRSGTGAAALSTRLWAAAWRGELTNDTFAALRRGIDNRFTVPEVEAAPAPRRRQRTRFSRWQGAVPAAGNWYRITAPEAADNALERDERNKDRARLLLDRYGIVFRELLGRELPALRWSEIFRALRLMELAGEALAGGFFHGIQGPQFVSHRALRLLRQPLPEQAVYWLNAADPASLCGSGLDALRGELPRRAVGTHLVYRGADLVMISCRNGKDLDFRVPPDDPRIQEYVAPLRHMLWRSVRPRRKVSVETINGTDAARSDYLDVLRVGFDVLVDVAKVVLYRKDG